MSDLNGNPRFLFHCILKKKRSSKVINSKTLFNVVNSSKMLISGVQLASYRPLFYLQVRGLSERYLQILTSKICTVGTGRRTLFHWHSSHATATDKCVKRLVCCTHKQSHTHTTNNCQRKNTRRTKWGTREG